MTQCNYYSPTPGYATCSREAGHEGPCAHDYVFPYESFDALANDMIDHLRAEVARLKRGDFTPEEFQNLCHNRDDKPGCTREDFCKGCRTYQDKLFGPRRERYVVIFWDNWPAVLVRANPLTMPNKLLDAYAKHYLFDRKALSCVGLDVIDDPTTLEKA